jgi:hypothetical protein
MKKVILTVVSLTLFLAGCGNGPPAGDPAETLARVGYTPRV